MTVMHHSAMPTRRAILAGALAGIVLPRRLRAQHPEAQMRIRCSFSDQSFTVRLHDNATARDLVSLLPLDLEIEDFSTNEKLAHLPRRLDEGRRPRHADPAPGDLCYFTGWGNLAFFHGDYQATDSLIRLGRLEGGIAPLLVKGKFALRIERAD